MNSQMDKENVNLCAQPFPMERDLCGHPIKRSAKMRDRIEKILFEMVLDLPQRTSNAMASRSNSDVMANALIRNTADQIVSTVDDHIARAISTFEI